MCCPPRQFPSTEGPEIVTWLGVRWFGEPWPKRVWVYLTGCRRVPIDSYPGCGCLVKLKLLWSIMRSWAKVWWRALRYA